MYIIIINHVYIYTCDISICTSHTGQAFFLKGEHNKKNITSTNLEKPNRAVEPPRFFGCFFSQVASERFRTSAGNFDVSQVFMHFQAFPEMGWKERVPPRLDKKPQNGPVFFSTQTWCFFFGGWMVGKPHQNGRF